MMSHSCLAFHPPRRNGSATLGPERNLDAYTKSLAGLFPPKAFLRAAMLVITLTGYLSVSAERCQHLLSFILVGIWWTFVVDGIQRAGTVDRRFLHHKCETSQTWRLSYG